MTPRSNGWHYFVKDSGSNFAECKQCGINVKTSGNTQNLWKHLDIHHPQIDADKNLFPKRIPKQKVVAQVSSEILSEIVEVPTSDVHLEKNNQQLPLSTTSQNKSSKTTTIAKSFEKIASFGASGPSTVKLNQALMYMVAKDNLPLRTVERKGFLLFCKTAVPLYKPPSRITLTRMLDEKFAILSKAIQCKLSAIKSYSLTADVWTETCSTRSFLGVTVHYLEECDIKSVALVARPLEGSHNKEHLGEEIRSTCAEWNIDIMKISVFVTDGGANIVAAVKEIVGEKRHFVCVDHTLNRMTTVAIEKSQIFENLLTKIRAIVTYFKRSVNAADSLRAIQLKNGKSEANILKLKKDEPTRWGSTFQMLDRFILLAEEVGTVLLRQNAVPMLSGSELCASKEGRDLLHPVAHVITELESEKKSVAGKVIPLMSIMKKLIDSIEPTTEAVKQLKFNLINQFEKRFEHIEFADNLAIATLLDPRFKALYLKPLAHARAVKAITDIVDRNLKAADTTVSSNESHVRVEPTSKSLLWDLHETLVEQSSALLTLDKPGGISGELRNFLHQPVVPRQSDPFQTWELIKTEYGHIWPIAYEFLSRMVTSVPSERLFSKTGSTYENRYRLNPQRMAQLTFLSSLDDDVWV